MLGEEDEEYLEDGEDEDDVDAEAEEIARRLGDELWAEISKAQAEVAAATSSLPSNILSTSSSGDGLTPPISTPNSTSSGSKQIKKIQEALVTMNSILTYVSKDPLAHSALQGAIVPELNGANVLDVLKGAVSSGTLSKEVAKPLSHLLVSLARSGTLFSSLRHSNASSLQLEQGKRKRDERGVGGDLADTRAPKRQMFSQNVVTIHTQLDHACQLITNALDNQSSREETLDSSLISSIQFQLHQVFLFAVTSSSQVVHERNTLQEIGGLIQVLGVLSGIQIGGPTPSVPPTYPLPPTLSTPWVGSGASDIGTAVYPCLFPSCNKTFSRLYSLRAHQRLHSAHRPFHCDFCPASFARNHDLKRHTKLHEKLAWKCGGCDTVFSRRDAIKRHKNSRSKGEACAAAEVIEVEVEKAGGEDELRRMKVWSGLAMHQPAVSHILGDGQSEEGEIQTEVLLGAQEAVLRLHAPLQECVARALGNTPDQAVTRSLDDPAGGQATLASVIARAQAQAQPHVVSPGLVGSVAAPPRTLSLPAPTSATTSGSLAVSQIPPSSLETGSGSSLSLFGLSAEQAKMLEEAIANAASAAQLQAEAEAALEEEDDEEEDEDDEEDDGDADGMD
ncbi:hypothetical protein BV25DRAFT_1867744 [Artomyces pyxidatus]|uniref:Uncharacterized protein n=1 Tax=Artomyces pyxidatus TaxID=48021 RepID=A0ACB8TFK6_9AGAM|nr:hypothetical protein BV25DRAFT_1867744 [Artomyces pyxidatus]